MASTTLSSSILTSDSEGSRHIPCAVRQELSEDIESANGTWNVPATLEEFIRRVCDELDSGAKPQAVYLKRSPMESVERIIPATQLAECNSYARVLEAACTTALKSNAIEIQRQVNPNRTLVALPLDIPDGKRHAIGFVFDSAESTSTFPWIARSIAYQACVFEQDRCRRRADREATETAALLELMEAILESSDLQQACYRLASALQIQMECKQVAVGFQADTWNRPRLLALSGTADFDRKSEFASTVESMMEWTIQSRSDHSWSNIDDGTLKVEPAFRSISEKLNADNVACFSLTHSTESSAVAVVVFDTKPTQSKIDNRRFIQASDRVLSSGLTSVHRGQSPQLQHIFGLKKGSFRSWKQRAALAAIGFLGLGLFIPGQHTIHCQSQLEPIACRYVSAPFDGTLEKAFVKPGDLVATGDLLASMDGREIRWKRASVLADQNQAGKKRDAAQASHNYSDQQIAQLEIERLALEIKLLDHHAENLEITSPVDGIVTTGDLARVEGAPLTIGQTLFEVAPLERMIAEIAIPDDQIAYARLDQSVDLRLDAYPGKVWPTKIVKIQPRSEIRDEANVFIAEVELDNADGDLRPGMKGRAKFMAGHRSYGWILFHEPIEYLSKKFGW